MLAIPRFVTFASMLLFLTAACSSGSEGDAGPTEPEAPIDPALAACTEFISTQAVNRDLPGWKTRLNKPPQFTFDPGSDYFWNLTTNKGAMTLRFMPDVAPMHVSSTMYLTELGFYDDIVFHRIIPGFMAQGGCPEGLGSGGPGYQFSGEYDSNVRHDRAGMLSMAHKGPGTDGSQFFITLKDTHHLDGKHTIFGEVVEGMDTLTILESLGSGSGKTSTLVRIEKATITVAPKADD
jgi:peptidyl-prolyl cis-trans isomerase B (cyclophilin B)